MKTELIHAARAALDNADSEIVLLLSDAQQLWPAALTVDGLEFDCLCGSLDDRQQEIWAVDCSGYWMTFNNLSSYVRGKLEDAFLAKLQEVKRDNADKRSEARRAFDAMFPSVGAFL